MLDAILLASHLVLAPGDHAPLVLVPTPHRRLYLERREWTPYRPTWGYRAQRWPQGRGALGEGAYPAQHILDCHRFGPPPAADDPTVVRDVPGVGPEYTCRYIWR